MFCAEVKHPPFTRSKKQLSKLEVDTIRELAQVRIHVERYSPKVYPSARNLAYQYNNVQW